MARTRLLPHGNDTRTEAKHRNGWVERWGIEKSYPDYSQITDSNGNPIIPKERWGNGGRNLSYPSDFNLLRSWFNDPELMALSAASLEAKDTTCQLCGRQFTTFQGRNAHLRYCSTPSSSWARSPNLYKNNIKIYSFNRPIIDSLVSQFEFARTVFEWSDDGAMEVQTNYVHSQILSFIMIFTI